MTPQTKARLIAAIALPLMALNIAQAHAAPAPSAAAATAETRMDHISFVTMGRGSPVILIPGLSSPRAVWNGVASALAKTHRVILVQVNGFGGDDPGANLKPGLLNGVVADLDAYIVKNKLQGAAVIGHSLGGLVSLMLAKAHSSDVGRLMIVDALPFIGDAFVPGSTVEMVAPQAGMMRDQMAAAYGKPANPAAMQAIAAHNALQPGSRALIAGWAAKADPRVTAEAFYEDMTTDLRPDMAGIAMPITLIYHWSADLPKERAEPLYRGAYAKAPHVTVIDFGNSGHFVMLDQPEAFAKVLMAFVG